MSRCFLSRVATGSTCPTTSPGGSGGASSSGADDVEVVPEDGITDETRDSGPGQLIEGADAIRAAVAARYGTPGVVQQRNQKRLGLT